MYHRRRTGVPFPDAEVPRGHRRVLAASGDIRAVAIREGICFPSKGDTAMAAGMPILVIAGPDDESRIVGGFDAGIQVSRGDVVGVVCTIERWRSDPELVGERGGDARTTFEAHILRSSRSTRTTTSSSPD